MTILQPRVTFRPLHVLFAGNRKPLEEYTEKDLIKYMDERNSALSSKMARMARLFLIGTLLTLRMLECLMLPIN
jgi:hypothetical protein